MKGIDPEEKHNLSDLSVDSSYWRRAVSQSAFQGRNGNTEGQNVFLRSCITLRCIRNAGSKRQCQSSEILVETMSFRTAKIFDHFSIPIPKYSQPKAPAGPGKTRIHCGGSIVNSSIFLKCRIVLPRATFVMDTKNVFGNLQKYFCGAQQCRRVLPRAGNIAGHNVAATMCPRFAGALVDENTIYYTCISSFFLVDVWSQ